MKTYQEFPINLIHAALVDSKIALLQNYCTRKLTIITTASISKKILHLILLFSPEKIQPRPL